MFILFGESEVIIMKVNCWEHKKCGRHPGGHKVQELGICPVTVSQHLSGAHGGKSAGRACWAVAGSLCGGKVQGSYAQKLNNCWRCDFMNLVKKEEDPNPLGFSATRLGMEKTLEKQNMHSGAAAAQTSTWDSNH
jgi:hypothetical protein